MRRVPRECITQPKNLFVANCVHNPADGQRIDVVTVQFRERIEVKAQPKACVKTVILRFKVEGDDLIALDGGTFSVFRPRTIVRRPSAPRPPKV